MEKDNEVSVLMSVYLKEKPEYLSACLDSMLTQTYRPDEIVLVKDGPITDELNRIIDNFQFNCPDLFKIIPLETNVGLGKALAIGVEACSHQLIARMDTDDIAVPDRIEKQRKHLINNPNSDIVGSDILEFEMTIKNVVAKKVVPHGHEEIYKYAKRRNPFNHMTVMYRKEAVVSAGNYVPLNGYEDYYLWVRMLKQGSHAYNIPEVLVYARAGQEMYERRGGWNYFKDGLRAQRQIYQIGLASPIDFIVRIFSQGFVNLVPNKVRGFIYKKLLRV